MSRLEEVVSALERGDLNLDLALDRYEEGVRLVGRCREALEQAELRVKRLVTQAGQSQVEEIPSETLLGGSR